MISQIQTKEIPGAMPTPVGVVLVLSPLQLMSQTVAAALRGRGAVAEHMGWALGVHRATHDLTENDVVLLLDDLRDRDSVLATQDLVAQSAARFLVLTDCPEGPSWGALLASGAGFLMPTQSSLDEVDAALGLVRRGVSPMAEARRAHLVRAWVRWLAEDNDLRARMERLSPRERTVIHLLARGYRVSDISSELGIADATVRSQIKSMRSKLAVGSQLAAVAVVHRLGIADDESGPSVPKPRAPQR